MDIRRLLAYLLLTVAYIVSGKLGLMLALPPGYTSPIFPPAGIAVAAALIGGKKTLPWLFLGALLLNVWVGYSSSQQIDTMGFAVASVIAIASMLQAAIGGWGLRRAIGYPVSLDNSGEVLRFLLLTPIICLTSASLSVSGLLVLGIIDTASFATNWAAWWVGDTLGVLVMLPMVMTVAGEPRALWQRRKRTVAVPMLLVCMLFVMIFLKANQWEYADSLMEFRQLSQQAVNQVESKLGEQETVLEEMAALFIHDVDGHVTREEFHRFVEKSLERFPMTLQAIEWALPVDAAHRARFEAAQRKDFPDFEIRERNVAGQLQRAGERASYYPVTYIEPLADNETALGFDLTSSPERQAALTEAIQCETAVITPAVQLVQDKSQQAGVLLLLAVNPHKKESGTVLTVLRLGDFMDMLLRDTRPMLYTRLVDLGGQKTIYDNFAPGNPHALYEHTFNFGTRLYRLETAPTPAYFMQHHGWQSWSVLAAGILGTGLLGALFLLGTGYTSRIEAQVEDRTRKLKESESRFRNIMEHAPIGKAITALDGHITQVNQAFCAMLGYEKEELEKLIFQDITHPEDLALSLANMQPLLAGKVSSYQFEKRYLHKDGHTVWTQIASSLERDDSGAPLYFIVQIEDITKRKQMEATLRDKEYLLLESQRIAHVGSWHYDLTGPLIWSDETYRIYRVSPDTFTPNVESLISLIHPDDRQAMQAWITACATGKEPDALEFRIITPDGTVRALSGYGELQYNAENRPRNLLGIVHDITERKQAEEQTRIAATAFESQEGMIISDADSVILRVNRAFTEITGYTAEEAVGQTPRLLKSGRHDAAFYAVMWKSIQLTGAWRGEIWNRRKNGEVYPEQLTITAVKGADGKITHYVATLHDITERKATEAQIYNLAFYDALTQLPNRRLLNDRLGQTMAASKRSGRYGALMFMDLDNFKPLNDTYGHGVGDLLLAEVAHRIGFCVRETDTVARFGGDEFVVMLSELDEDKAESTAQASLVAEKIRASLAEPFLLTIRQEGKSESTIEHHCTSSIGVVLFFDREASSEDILKWADIAMYQAKEEGRNRVVINHQGSGTDTTVD